MSAAGIQMRAESTARTAPAAPPRPRLGYVVKMFPRFSETFILNELLELERRGAHVTVYSLKRPGPGPVHPDVAHLAARVVYLPERPWDWLRFGPWAVARFLRRRPKVTLRILGYVLTRRTHQAWKRLFQAAVLATDLEEHPADRLHAHFASAPSRVAWLAGELARLPFSFTAHAKDIYQHSLDRDLLRDKIHAAQFVVTVSDFNRRTLLDLSGVSDHNVRRLYNGVDLQSFSPAITAARPELVLAVGRLVEKKGFDDLLRAWPLVRAARPEARLVVVGDGPEHGRLTDLARRLGVESSITWTGPEPQERVRAWLDATRVFCLPCRVAADGNRDGLPTVLLEAMAAGVACVSTRLTGIPEIVRDDQEGRLVPPGDATALADAIVSLLEDPVRCRAMGERGRVRAEELFDLRRNVGQLLAWFEGRT
ncbi:MAG: glycosyltransferase family 4 protein [Candidatus Eiseniibacteriota bacterium]